MRLTGDVYGGSLIQQQVAMSAVSWCADILIPKIRRINIDVNARPLKRAAKKFAHEEIYGYCERITNRDYCIEVEKHLKVYDFVTTICHEMVHVMQYSLGLMVEKKVGIMWKNRVCHIEDYSRLPWERQASRMELKLCNGFFKYQGFSVIPDRELTFHKYRHALNKIRLDTGQ